MNQQLITIDPPTFDTLQKAALNIFLGITMIGMCSLSARDTMQKEYCQPFKPTDVCKLSRYEVRIHDITVEGKRLIGMAEGACVFTVGEGKFKRYAMTDVQFTSMDRTDYFERVEFPAAQSLVCEVR